MNGVGELTGGRRREMTMGEERGTKMGTKEDKTGDRGAFILLSSSSGHLYLCICVFFLILTGTLKLPCLWRPSCRRWACVKNTEVWSVEPQVFAFLASCIIALEVLE